MATETASLFSTSGSMARPAGVAGLLASMPGGDKGNFQYGETLPKATGLRTHALRHHTPYAEVVPGGWTAKEPLVKPTAANVGAGVVSAGSIDNTYVPMPLQNRWGKARERARNEMYVPPHKQATDLVIVAKGGSFAETPQSVDDMVTVRPTYSRTIPLFHPIGPQREDAGFIRSPNIIPGALPPPISPMLGLGDLPEVPANHAALKLAYDQGMRGVSRIPVSKLVRNSAEATQSTVPVPTFFSKSAGLPGGLSLIPTETKK